MFSNYSNKNGLFLKMFRNSFYNVLSMGINLISFALLTPFLVNELGTETYGIYLIVNSIAGFMSIMDFGVSGASVRQFSYYFAKKDIYKFNQVFSCSVLIYSVIGIVFSGIILMLIKSNIIWGFFGQGLLNKKSIEIALYLSVVTIFLNLILGVFSNVTFSIQRNDLYALGNIIITVTQIPMTIVLVKSGYGLIGVLFAKIISILIGIFSYSIINRKLIGPIKLIFEFEKVVFKDLISFGFYNFLTQISNGLIGQLDKVIISASLGPEFVTYYSVPLSVTQRIHSFVATAANVIFPVTSELQANNQKNIIVSLYRKSQNLILLICSLLILPFLLFTEDIFSIWIGKEFAKASCEIFTIILISYVFIGSNIPSYFMFNGLNLPKYNAYYSVLSALIKILGTLLLIDIFSIKGAAISLLISTVTVPFFIYFFEKKVTSAIDLHFLFKGYFPIGASMVIVYHLKNLLISQITDNIFILILLMLIFTNIYIVTLYILRFFHINKINLIKLVFRM
jgi:O-antigen/teichoic acid export membrane protein